MIKEVEIDKIYSKIKAYLENKNPYVRYRAAEQVNLPTEKTSNKVIDSLLNALKNEDSSVRYSAAVSLLKLPVEQLLKALVAPSQNSFVRRKTADVIGYYGFDEEVERAIKQLSRDPDEEVRPSGEQALRKYQYRKDISEQAFFNREKLSQKNQVERKSRKKENLLTKCFQQM